MGKDILPYAYSPGEIAYMTVEYTLYSYNKKFERKFRSIESIHCGVSHNTIRVNDDHLLVGKIDHLYK